MKSSQNIRFLFIASLIAVFVTSIRADDAKDGETFGPYVAISRNADIVQNVKVEDNGRIYLLLNPDHREKEIILKNSSGLKTGYRKWHNGELELISPANQGKAPGEYTDWVTTSGNYIEYYMDGALILHLKKKGI